mmetsp:Transcript_10805/g.27808  ORF Transcript_10805/g.27808 Transcript_10805/m.27808 type:complete len:193 (-) Transcript_10805:377-955(-)
MSATFQMAEAKRIEANKAKEAARKAGLELAPLSTAPRWDPAAATSVTAAAQVTAKIDHQYTAPFPSSSMAPEPKSIVCPTMRLGVKPFARTDPAPPPAIKDRPGRKRGGPKGNDLGAGFNHLGTTLSSSTPAADDGPAAPEPASATPKTTMDILTGTSTADAFFVDPSPGVTQPERFYRPYQSNDRSYAAQW